MNDAHRFADQAKSIAQEGFERLLEAVPHLRRFHSRAAAWATESSWWRLALIGLVVVIAMSVVGDILGVDEPVVIDTHQQKDVKIDVANDSRGVVITPKLAGVSGNPIVVPLPSSKKDDDDDDDDKSKAKDGEKGEKGERSVKVDDHGLSFEKDGKRYLIDDKGVHVVPLPPLPPPSPSAPQSAQVANSSAVPMPDGTPLTVEMQKEVDAAKKEAAAAQKEALALQKQRDEEFRSDVASAISDAKEELQDSISEQIEKEQRGNVKRHQDFAFWGFLKVLLTIFFAYLIAVKVSSATKRRADAMVKNASEVAEQESLRRQLLEARLQTMQAQVEPHFLFNTLASVDYLIETDPARASTMQKNLIQYLRASMPQMRGAATQLGREVDLCTAFLEILKVRMEERLSVSIAVPDGLRSADFPPMMLQSMVENAIKHGLEPKAEGGDLSLVAEIVDGDLHVTVADTGLGFSESGASTSGGGVGLSNIRERLQLLYAGRGRLEITPNQPCGTRVSIIVPYQPVSRRATAEANKETAEETK
jgi:signal transduction histidine kinase